MSRRPVRVLVTLVLAATFAALALVAVASPAGAHAQVSATEPKADSRITALPARVVIHVLKKQATKAGDPIQVYDPDGVRVDNGIVELSDAGATISVGMQTSARRSGTYNVLYIITSADTHIIHDRFSFTLTPMSNEAVVGASPAPGDGAVRSGPQTAIPATNGRLRVVGPPGGSVLAAGLVLLALLTLLVILVRRRRHRRQPAELGGQPGFRVLSTGEHRIGPAPVQQLSTSATAGDWPTAPATRTAPARSAY
jgi:methionine-rich copper-binding protein CopC